MAGATYTIEFPPDYLTEAWIYEAKGTLEVDVELSVPIRQSYRINFLDLARFIQDLRDEATSEHFVIVEQNTVVVGSVNRDSIERAVYELSEQQFKGLMPSSMQ